MPDATPRTEAASGQWFIGGEGQGDEGPGGGFMAEESEDVGNAMTERKATIDDLSEYDLDGWTVPPWNGEN